MKKCPKCGTAYDATTRFCSLCGTPLQEEQRNYKKGTLVGIVLLVLAGLVTVLIWNYMIVKQERDKQYENNIAQTESKWHTSDSAGEGGSSESFSMQSELDNSKPMDTGTVQFDNSSDIGEDYILPESDTQYISTSDVAYLTDWELRLARNEIFARRGRIFDDPSLAVYFSSKPWYHGIILPEDFSEDSLSKIEKENIEVIKAEEARR